MKKAIFWMLILGLGSSLEAGTISRTNYVDGQSITAALQNANENTIVNEINGSLTAANITDGSLTGTDMADNTITVGKLDSVIQSSITLMEVKSATQTITATKTFSSNVSFNGAIAISSPVAFNSTNGNSGEVLCSSGSNVPRWTSSGLVGGYRLITSSSVNSGATSITIDNLNGSLYSAFELVIVDILPLSNTVGFYLQVSTTAGASVTTVGYNYEVQRTVSGSFSATGEGAASQAQFSLASAVNPLITTGYSVVKATIFNPVAVPHVQVEWTLRTSDTGGGRQFVTGGGSVGSSLPVQGFKLSFSSGNFSSGKVYVYGLLNS